VDAPCSTANIVAADLLGRVAKALRVSIASWCGDRSFSPVTCIQIEGTGATTVASHPAVQQHVIHSPQLPAAPSREQVLLLQERCQRVHAACMLSCKCAARPKHCTSACRGAAFCSSCAIMPRNAPQSLRALHLHHTVCMSHVMRECLSTQHLFSNCCTKRVRACCK
jgi:hypothetical protein